MGDNSSSWQWIATPGGPVRVPGGPDPAKKDPPASWDPSGIAPNTYGLDNSGLPTIQEHNITADQTGHQYSVSTKAIMQYVDVLDQLVTPLMTARDKLSAVKIHSGKFQASHQLMVKVNGGTASAEGVAAQYATELADMAGAVDALAAGLADLAQKYTTAEELNSAEANKALGELLNDFSANMPGGSSY